VLIHGFEISRRFLKVECAMVPEATLNLSPSFIDGGNYLIFSLSVGF
jgi:hypothetical protein